MFTKDTELLLQKSLAVLPSLVSGRSLRHDIDELVAMLLPPSRVAIVDDVYTAESLGNQVFKALKGRFSATHITLDRYISADSATCNEVERRSEGCDAYIAVGSGTINDICKHVSFKNNKPYMVFATAASMNGYLSANASISEDGYKHTLPAHMPMAVFCDLSVIASAPARLSISGLGDSLARPTAQADWLLSHMLLGTDYNEAVFALLGDNETQVFENARGIASGDLDSIEALMRLLLLSGLGMTIAKGSYPASQAEHMIAHLYNMGSDYAGKTSPAALPPLHGEEIAVTTLAMAHLQQTFLRSQPDLADRLFPKEPMTEYLGAHAAGEARSAYYTKLERIEAAGLSRDNIASRWSDIASAIEKIIVPPQRIESIAKAAGAPMQAVDLKWDESLYGFATSHARFTRDRFTFLDLA